MRHTFDNSWSHYICIARVSRVGTHSSDLAATDIVKGAQHTVRLISWIKYPRWAVEQSQHARPKGKALLDLSSAFGISFPFLEKIDTIQSCQTV